MCGIAGVVGLRAADVPPDLAPRMRDAILHRGPNGSGQFAAAGVGLAACRLAIVDLDPRGLMPLASSDGRYHIVHNGEIYNRPQLRDELLAAGVELRTTTDTEVLLHLYAREGEAMLDRLDGMFAFAVWDAAERELFAARDRCGEKPFYYAEHGGRLYFASEPKALFAAGVPCRFDEETWVELLTFRSTAGERTPYVGVLRLLPGHWLRARDGRVETNRWWRYPDDGEPVDTGRVGVLLEESVRRRLVADVPVGVLLSGGLDSSSVTTVAAALAGRLPAFTVRYEGTSLDEGAYAAAVAAKAGVDHYNVKVTPDELVALLAEAAWYLDEPMPFAAGPEVLAVSRHAQRHVRVLLSGEAADEVFGGYRRLRAYRHARLTSLAGRALGPFRLRLPAGTRWQRAAAAGGRSRLEWIASSSADLDLGALTSAPIREWAPYRAQAAADAVRERRDAVGQALAYERLVHLPSVLMFGDRLTMAAGVEARLPFTAPRLLELGARARPKQLFRGPHGKRPLREAMADRLPHQVLNRRKQGWTGPYGDYLRTNPVLRDWLRRVPDHAVVPGSPLGRDGARRVIDRFLDTGAGAQPAWTLGRIVLWHQVCVEGVRSPFERRA